MTVPALTKLEAAFRAPARPPEVTASAAGPTMHSATPAPQPMAQEFSGLGRAVRILHANAHGERSVLTVGAETSLNG